MPGYSGTPLAKKLGFKEGFRVKLTNAPDDYAALVDPVPNGIVFSTRIRSAIDLWHFFTKSRGELRRALPMMMNAIKQDGMVWVSWPKKASGIASTVTEDTIRELALPLGFVDVKVCAVDETWSGLKLVIRKKLRK